MDVLKNLYIAEMMNIVNARSGQKHEATLDNLLSNLKYLVTGNFDETTAMTEPKSWLPVGYKRMLLYILFGNEVYIDTSYSWEEDRCIGTCFIRETKTGGILAKASASSALEEIEPFNSAISNTKRKAICEGYACGSAETRALYRMGIGMQFVADIDNDMAKYTPGGNTNEKLEPEVPTNQQAMNALNEKFDKISGSSASDKPANRETVPDYEQVCIFGPKKGEPLKDVPAKFIAWMLASIDAEKNINDADKALLTDDYISNLRSIVNADERIKKVYDAYMKMK